MPCNLDMRHRVMMATTSRFNILWQGSADGGTGPALAPAEVLAAAKAFHEDGGGAADRAVVQVTWDGRQGLAAASEDGLIVFSLQGLRQRLADAGDGQVMALTDAETLNSCHAHSRTPKPLRSMSWPVNASLHGLELFQAEHRLHNLVGRQTWRAGPDVRADHVQTPDEVSGDATAASEDMLIVAIAQLPATPVAIDWTQAGDGLLVADADGHVTMWQLQMPPAAAKKHAEKPAADAAPSLHVAWRVNAERMQVPGRLKKSPACRVPHCTECSRSLFVPMLPRWRGIE